MKRPATKIVAAAIVIGAAIIGVKGARVAMRAQDEADSGCGAGFRREGARCIVAKDGACPSPLVVTEHGCDAAERDVVDVPKTTVTIGPSDWEAEGRVKPRVVVAGPFRIDRLEVTSGRAFCSTCPLADPSRYDVHDAARAAWGVTLSEARAFCTQRGGRLPTEDEWIVAAAGDRPRRYPWGDTGAVCRRAAWGLVKGPCATGAEGPDTVGSHPDGATPSGIHDLAGNVAEWVELPPETRGAGGSVRGGSYETELATELRTWPRREVSDTSRERSIGFRCAYDVP